MELAGRIQAKPDPPGIDRSAWIALIAGRDDLIALEPLTIINPFTKKPATIKPNKTSARLITEGRHVGSFDWSQNDENVVSVWCDLAHVRPVAEEIARELGGVFLTVDELEQ